MEAAGVDVSVLSVLPPGAAGLGSLSREAAAVANDELLDACRQAPGRLLMLAALPLDDPDASLKELERLRNVPEVRGVCAMAYLDGSTRLLDDSELEPVYRTLAAHGWPVVVHPTLEDFGIGLADPTLAGGLGSMVTSSAAALRLILSGLLDRIPTLDVILPHLGGVVPYLGQRLEEFATGRLPRPLESYLKERLYYDNCSFQANALEYLCRLAGAGRVMLGSDYPFRGDPRRALTDLEASSLDAEEKVAIRGGTASRWFAP